MSRAGHGRGATAVGQRGVLTDNAYGLNLLSDAFDPDAFSRAVFIDGNDTNVARVEMALPDAARLVLSRGE